MTRTAALSAVLFAVSAGIERPAAAQAVDGSISAPAGAGAAGAPAPVPAGLDLSVEPVGKTIYSPGAAPPAPARRATAVSAARVSGLRFIPASQPLKTISPASAPQRPFKERAAAVQAGQGDNAASVFDGSAEPYGGAAFIPLEHPRAPGLKLDKKPEFPEETETRRVFFERFDAPKKQGPLRGPLFGTAVQEDALELDGGPQGAAGVEAGLRAFIRRRPELFGRIKVEDLKTKLASKVEGQAGLSDMIYVNFRQQRNGLQVEGTYLNFQVKLFQGRTTVVGARTQLYPELDVDTAGALDEDQLKTRALRRLNLSDAAGASLRSVERKIMRLGGKWRTIQLFAAEKPAVMLAVDVNTGEAFAWDSRAAFGDSRSGIVGRGVKDGPQKTGAALGELPLGHVKITASDGKVFYADKDGYFTVEGAGGRAVELTMKLEGRYAVVNNRLGGGQSVAVKAKAGEKLRAVFNPEGADESAVADVNAYYFTTLTHDWTLARGIKPEGIDEPMVVNTNMDEECNGYYTAWSLNFFRSSSRCSNSAYSDVIPHEYWHGVDDLVTGIIDGALSEGWGDLAVMAITGQPLIGRGFLKGQTPDYIRTGENTRRYKPGDEVHLAGQVWAGFGWKLCQALKASIPDPLKAQELYEALIFPAIFAGAKDIPSAIRQVLLRDMDARGDAPHFKEIRRAAAAHGIQVRRPKASASFPRPRALGKTKAA